MTSSSRMRGYLFALAATIIWSGNFVLARGVAQHIAPFQLNFWRWAVALACVLPFALPKLRADWPGIRRHWRYVSIMGLIGVAGINVLIYKAAQSTQSLNMALLVPTAPIIILILSRILYAEPLTYRRLTGICVVLVGILTLISHGDWRHIAAVKFNSGDLWALAGTVAFGLFSLFMRKKPRDISNEGFNAAMFLAGVVMMVPALAWEASVMPPTNWNMPVIVSILYAGVGCSFASFLLWTAAITTIGPVLSGIVYYSLPLFAAVESVMILGERIALFHLVGGVLIIAGILVATVDKRLLGR